MIGHLASQSDMFGESSAPGKKKPYTDIYHHLSTKKNNNGADMKGVAELCSFHDEHQQVA